jgi:hypothetical protein
MSLQVRGDEIEIRYVDPPPGIEPLLLTGRWFGNALLATAYFTAGSCGVFPFEVHGGIDRYRNLAVRGQAPMVDMFECRQFGLEWNRNSKLVFTRPYDQPQLLK